MELAADLHFVASCEPPVGALLAVLAAAVPQGGRVLELGTGVGVGTSWLVAGLASRTDVTLTTLEADRTRATAVERLGLPGYVDTILGDAESQLPRLGQFDLIFADAEGGKWTGLDLTLNALRPGGLLVLDDMDPARYDLAEHRAAVARVHELVTSDARLVHVAIDAGTGILLASRKG